MRQLREHGLAPGEASRMQIEYTLEDSAAELNGSGEAAAVVTVDPVSGDVQLLINTPLGKLTQQDDYAIRRTALQFHLPYCTTLSAGLFVLSASKIER